MQKKGRQQKKKNNNNNDITTRKTKQNKPTKTKKNNRKTRNGKHGTLQVGESSVLFMRQKGGQIRNRQTYSKNLFEHSYHIGSHTLNKLPGFAHLTSGLASAKETVTFRRNDSAVAAGHHSTTGTTTNTKAGQFENAGSR